jgi:hypothetical protein
MILRSAIQERRVATLDLTSAQARIASLYATLFGRAPDAAGLDFWTKAAGTQSLTQIATSLLNSQEGAAVVAADGPAFVNALYATTLGRAPTSAELAAGVQTLAQGGNPVAARATLAASLVDTLATPMPATKPASMTDADYAQAIADRSTLANKVDAGVFFAQSSAGNNLSLAGRVLDNVGPTQASLDAARTLAVQGTATQVAELYAALLDRAPDAVGLAWWTAQLNSGVPMSSIVAGMLGSAEGVALYGTATGSQAFLETFYQSVFGRAPDAAGLSFWMNALQNAGGDAAARAKIVTQILDAVTGSPTTGADQKILANKAEAGKYFAASNKGNDIALAKTVIDQVTSDAASVNAAKQLIDTGTAPAVPGTPAPPASTTFLPNAGTTGGSSDASTAIALANNFMLVADDEASVLRIYSRDGGAAVKEISYDTALNLQGKEADLEGAARIGNTLYFIGSHGNNKSGVDQDNREWIASFTLTDNGADSAVTYVGKYTSLESMLSTWDSTDAHGKGVNHYGIDAAAAGGTPERTTGLGIEGLTVSPDNSSLWIGFRAPVTGGAAQKALIVQINNIDAVLAGNNAVAPVFGAAIELDLGGRGIRSIEKNAAGQYVIIAGPSGTASADVAHDFRLYTWDGSFDAAGQATHLTQNAVNLDALLATTRGSFESIVAVPDNLGAGSWIQLLQDNGDTIWPGQAQVSKDLPAAQQKFMGNWIQLGGAAPADATGPLLVRSTPADNAIKIATAAKIELTFDEPVRAGTGSFVLKSGATTLATIAADDVRVSYEYNKVTVDTSMLVSAANTTYSLEIANGAVLDAAGNAFGGLTAGSAIDFTTAPLSVPTSLAAGDIAFVGFNTDGGTDAFAFVLLKAVNTGTAIRFTDKEWNGTMFNSGEGDMLWTADSSLAAGTIVTIQPDTAFKASTGTLTGGGGGLGKTGEQMFAITGTVASPGTFLAAIGMGSPNGGLVANGADMDKTSLVPAGLTLGTNAVNVANMNAKYTGTLTGDAASLLASISDAAQWTSLGDTTPAAVTANQLVLGYPSLSITGPTKLDAGDVIFLGINTDSTDAFVFTVTKAIGAGTQIGFTDRDYTVAGGMPATGESAYLWTADQAYAAGTVITIQPDQSGANNPIVSHGTALGKGGGLSATAETVYAFQGSIAGLGAGTAGAITATTYLGAINAGGAAAGEAPAGITIQSIAVDNGFYNKSRDATDIDALKAAVTNSTNWTVNDDTAIAIVGNNMVFPA